ncbi:MAG: hypothetical protein VKJ04_11860 [Vampirovibrionales bacterium]|nr:hypothetical protein [Vampirovibrionales bacterium]
MKLTGRSDSAAPTPPPFGMGKAQAADAQPVKPTLPSLSQASPLLSAPTPMQAKPYAGALFAKEVASPDQHPPFIHPLNSVSSLNFSANSLSAQTRRYVSDIFTLTRASASSPSKNVRFKASLQASSSQNKTSQATATTPTKSSSIGFRFSSNRWNAGNSVMVFDVHPAITTPLAFSAEVPSMAETTQPFNSSGLESQAQDAPSATLRLSPFEKLALSQSQTDKNRFATAPLAFQGTLPAKTITFAEQIQNTLATTNYQQNPFDVLSRIGKFQGQAESSIGQSVGPAQAQSKDAFNNGASLEKPDYTLQAYSRIIRPASELPIAIQAIAESDERLRTPNAIARYAYLPNSQTVLKQPLDMVTPQPLWYTAAIQFAAQAVKPVIEAAPWLKSFNPLGLSVDENALWFGSRWNVPLMEYRTSDGQPARLYEVTRLDDGQLAQVVSNVMVDEVSLNQKQPTLFSVGDNPLALVGAPQSARQSKPLTPFPAEALNPRSAAQATRAIAANTPSSSASESGLLNETANASSTGPLSAPLISSRAQPKFGSRAYYRQWMEELVARFETKEGVTLLT